MGEVTGGEQPPVLPIERSGVGIRATRVLAAEDISSNDIGMRADFWIKGLRVSNIYDDRQAAGRSFYATALAVDLPNNGVLEVFGEIPEDLVVVTWSTAAGVGATLFEVFEDTEVSDNGTPLNSFNKNRIFRDEDSRLPLFTAPTITADGNKIIESYILAGERKDAAQFETSIGDLVLRPGTNYLMRATNVSGQASTTAIALFWFDADIAELPERAQKKLQPLP